jgi:hypothetical protein
MQKAWRVQDVIAIGGQSTVFRVTHRGLVRAWKTYNGKRDEEREIDALEQLHHPNIIDTLGTKAFDINDQPKTGILFPLMGMNLRALMQQEGYTTREAFVMTLQMVKAMKHGHDRGILHMDIKPENICVTSIKDGKMTCKLVDWASCINLTTFQGEEDKTRRGTPGYMAPELKQGIFGPFTDMYALGVVCKESNMKCYGRITKQTGSMIHKDYKLRPDAKELLRTLGESMHLLWPNDKRASKGFDIQVLQQLSMNSMWRNPLVNCVYSKMDLFSPDSFDESVGLQKLVTLIRSSDHADIYAAYYMLHELALEEVFGDGFNMYKFNSVISFLPYFLARLDAGPEAKLLFCRTIDILSRMPEFMLTGDILFTLRSLSQHKYCERNVLCVMSRCMNAQILQWCESDGLYRDDFGRVCGLWGSGKDGFSEFVNRFIPREIPGQDPFPGDWNTDARNAALRLLGLPEDVVTMDSNAIFLEQSNGNGTSARRSQMETFFNNLPPIATNVPNTPKQPSCAREFDDYCSDNDEFLLALGGDEMNTGFET